MCGPSVSGRVVKRPFKPKPQSTLFRKLSTAQLKFVSSSEVHVNSHVGLSVLVGSGGIRLIFGAVVSKKEE